MLIMSAGRCLSEQYILRVIFRKYIFKSSVEMVLFPLNYLYLFFLYELTQNISSASRSFAHNCFVVRHVALASLTCIPIYRYGKYFFVISSYISKTAPMDGLVFYHIYIYILFQPIGIVKFIILIHRKLTARCVPILIIPIGIRILTDRRVCCLIISEVHISSDAHVTVRKRFTQT